MLMNQVGSTKTAETWWWWKDFDFATDYDANRLDLLNSVNAILLPHGLMINLSNEELLKVILYGHDQL